MIESKINNTKELIVKLEQAYADHLKDMGVSARKKAMRKQKEKKPLKLEKPVDQKITLMWQKLKNWLMQNLEYKITL